MRPAAFAVAITLVAVAALPVAKLLALGAGAAAILWYGRRATDLVEDTRGIRFVLSATAALIVVLFSAALAEDPALAFGGTRLGVVPLALIICISVIAAGLFRDEPALRTLPAVPLALASYAEPALAAVAVWLAPEGRQRWVALAAACAWTIWHGSWAGIAGLAAGAILQRRDWKIPAIIAASSAGVVFRMPDWFAQTLLWRDALLAVLRRPVFGFGPENFKPSFAAWESVDLALASPGFFYMSSNNAAIDIAAATGIVGVGMLAYLTYRLLQGARITELATSSERTALIALLVAYTFTGLTPASFLLFGLLAATIYANARPLPRNAPEPEDVLIHQTVAERLVETRVTASGHRMQVVRKKIRKRARHKHRSPMQSIGAAAPVLLRLMHVAVAVGFVAALWITTKPWLADNSGDAWTRETRRASNPGEDYVEVAYRLSQLAAERGELRLARSLAQQAIAAAPNWYKPRWLLAQIYERDNRRPRAQAEASRAARLVPHANHSDRDALTRYVRSLD